jgi:type VI secretion system secreted protein Hcp
MLTDSFFPRLTLRIQLIALPLATALFLLGAPMANADDIFIKIDGIEGESRVAKFEGMIQAHSWNWGMDQSASLAYAESRTGAKVNVRELSFTHYLDKATPLLMQYCASGRPLRGVYLYVRRSGKSTSPYVVLKLTDVFVSNVTVGGVSSAEPMVEEVSLRFSKFQFSYQPMDEMGTARGAAIQTGWDIAANKPL